MEVIKTTALCPGQGAQTVGMGRAWFEASDAARAVFERADAVLAAEFDASLSHLCFEGPAEAVHRTNVSQPAIYTVSIACWHGLYGADAIPTAAAGLSLGEYTALHLAGAFSFEDGLRLVAKRGALMQKAAEATDGGMVAVMGASVEEAEQFCEEISGSSGVLVPANINAPGQIVLSGDTDACNRAVEACSDRGWRATLLSVAGAFHSPLMASAADAMLDVLAETEILSLQAEVWTNVTASRYPADSSDVIRRTLADQITSPVRWSSQMAAMIDAGMGCWTELAPGKVLKGLMRRIDRAAKVDNHDQPDTTVST